jgi:all-trans-retinol dehydrogenase (NAD+)
MAINVEASFHLLRAFLPSMRRLCNSGGSACCVLVASTMGLIGSARLADYCASKAAVLGLAESLRFELARDGLGQRLGIVAVCPYHVGDTTMFRGVMRERGFFPSVRALLFPSLRAAAVASVIVDYAAAGRDAVAVLPWYAFWVIWLARCLPLWLADLLLGSFGGWHAMEGFQSQSPPVNA